ncbi:MAG: ferredoxin--nitrite reductase [Dehalococcoidia bacterium]|nr:ferredoxin--nitrite reductase [Dehalococcoidia bacterium]
MQVGTNSIERLKAEKDGLDIQSEIEELAAQHGGWETMDAPTRERLKWIGTFYRKPTPGQFMMRIRITGGQATSDQLRALAAISRRQGNGILDITTRQQIELRAIQISSVPGILEAMEGVDLSSLQTGMDNVRNVNTCPLSGLTNAELLDAAPVGEELTRLFLNNKEFTNLPRKFNVTITGCLENCTHTETQDVGMTPAVRRSDGFPGFNVAVGGKMGSGGMTIAQPLNVFVEPHEAAALTGAIILLFRDEGSREQRSRARLAFLVEDWGIERFRAELERRWGKPLQAAGRDVRLATHTDHLGVEKQQQSGLWSVGLCVLTGRVNGEHLEELARLADTYGSGHVRLTPAQNAVLVNVPEQRLPTLLAEPLLKELSPQAHSFTRGMVTCIGTDYCNLALIETKTTGRDLAERLAERFPLAEPLTMHWSGCPAGCGNHQAADIGFQGTKARIDGEVVDAVSIFVGGQTGPNARPAEMLMDLVPVTMLDDVMPLLISNLETLKKVRRVPEAEESVLMVPALP